MQYLPCVIRSRCDAFWLKLSFGWLRLLKCIASFGQSYLRTSSSLVVYIRSEYVFNNAFFVLFPMTVNLIASPRRLKLSWNTKESSYGFVCIISDKWISSDGDSSLCRTWNLTSKKSSRRKLNGARRDNFKNCYTSRELRNNKAIEWVVRNRAG